MSKQNYKRSERLTVLRPVSIPSRGDGLEGRVGVAPRTASPCGDIRDVAGSRRGIPGVRLERCDFRWGQQRDATLMM